jgi:SagB-type dehydrogenase family enzyme
MTERESPRNRQTESARRYHEQTVHTPRSIRASRHALVWENKPSPFKIYPDLPSLDLPREFHVGRDTFEALTGTVQGPADLDLDRLAGLLFFSAGITKKRSYPGGEIYFRAAPSTGALYQTEVYVVLGPISGVRAGVYHFSPGDFVLRRLRDGDFRGVVAEAAADLTLARVPAVLVLSSIYWRNTWKYQARGYRHLFWDAGSMLANTLAVAGAFDLPARLVTGFVDARLNDLLGLDPMEEAALVLVAVGAEIASSPDLPPVDALRPAVIPLSARTVDYPALRAAYDDSCLGSAGEVVRWRARSSAWPVETEPRASGPSSAELPPPRTVAGRALGETILRRGSTRQFSGESICAGELSATLYHATRGFDADVPSGLVRLYVNVHGVAGIAPGAYAYRPRLHRLDPVKLGDFRAESAFLCLEQPLGGTSSMTVFFLADLARVLEGFGNRGYRLANLEAGLIGGRLYLAAYGQGFGATGLTFYDRAVVEFFSPDAAAYDAIFVTAVGRSVRGGGGSPALFRVDRSG